MTDLYNGVQSRNGVNRVTPTGELVINAMKDVDEYCEPFRRLDAGHGALENISKVFGWELAFGRVGKHGPSAQSDAFSKTLVPAFASFNGATHEPEDVFKLLGYFRNTSQHQGMAGRELSGIVAIAFGGSATITCRSAIAIPAFARVMWSIPRTPGLAIDGTGNGRLLAELSEFKISQDVFQPIQMHSILKTVKAGADTSKLSTSERAKFVAATNFWDSEKTIMFTGIVMVRAKELGRPLRDSEKMAYAVMLGLVGPVSTVKSEMMEQRKEVKAFELELIDGVYQMYTDRNKNSHKTGKLSAFPLLGRGIKTKDRRQQLLAQMQVNQVKNVFDSVITPYDAVMSRVFCWTTSGGLPGHDFDIVMNRL